MSDARLAYQALLEQTRATAVLESTLSLLDWDQETTMPSGGSAAPAVFYRAGQTAQIAGLAHQWRTDPRIPQWLDECRADGNLSGDPESAAAVNLREIRRAFDRATRLPTALVQRFAQTVPLAKHAWAEARRSNDFSIFQPWLEKVLALNRRQAECWGWPAGGEAWDALADGHEPGMTGRDVETLFKALRGPLVQLVGEATGRTSVNPLAGLRFPIQAQRLFVRDVISEAGFDLERGRLDDSNHPFCCGMHRDDVRLTSRFHEEKLLDALGSCLHEAGHGIYEQNLPGGVHAGTPMGTAVSLGVHESQSRLLENQVGRSLPFWVWCRKRLAKYFGQTGEGLSARDLFLASNRVEAQPIRVESDEVTYNLHILIRFDLERALMSGNLSCGDLPGAWNQAYKDLLGLRIKSDREGCLQDIHWSHGAMGYFPTYTLGNLLAGQLFEQAGREIRDLDSQIEAGRFQPLMAWLTQKVHCHGMRYSLNELCLKATGKPLSHEPLLRHLRSKVDLVVHSDPG